MSEETGPAKKWRRGMEDTSRLMEQILTRSNVSGSMGACTEEPWRPGSRRSHGGGIPCGLENEIQGDRRSPEERQIQAISRKAGRYPQAGRGERKLGIPTVQDRHIQQMILQVLTPIYEELFSDGSWGFRPGRSAHGAVRTAKGYVEEGTNG